jgi:hypothetical protein
MAPPSSRPRAAKPAPPVAPIGADRVEEETLSAAARHFKIERAQMLAITVADDRVVVVTTDGRKLIWEA